MKKIRYWELSPADRGQLIKDYLLMLALELEIISSFQFKMNLNGLSGLIIMPQRAYYLKM